MGILADHQIAELLPTIVPMEDERDPSLINPASLDVRVGACYEPHGADHPSVADSYGIHIMTNQMILVEMYETIHIPNHLAACLYMKSSLARQGLNHLLAMWIDPGWNGAPDNGAGEPRADHHAETRPAHCPTRLPRDEQCAAPPLRWKVPGRHQSGGGEVTYLGTMTKDEFITAARAKIVAETNAMKGCHCTLEPQQQGPILEVDGIRFQVDYGRTHWYIWMIEPKFFTHQITLNQSLSRVYDHFHGTTDNWLENHRQEIWDRLMKDRNDYIERMREKKNGRRGSKVAETPVG